MAEKRLDNTTALRQVLFTILKICISGSLIYFLLARIGFGKLLDQLTTANIYWILASICIFSLSNILGSVQWYLLLKSKAIRLSLWRVIKFYHVGLFFNNFLIGYVGGDAFRIYDIRKSSGDTNGALTTVFFDRFIGFFMLSSLAVMVTMIWMKKITSHVTVYTIVVVFAIWALGFYFLFQEKVARKFSWLLKFFLPKMIHVKLKEIYYELNKFRHNKILLLQIFAIAFGVQTFRILTHYFAAKAVGVELDMFYFFIFVPIIALAASLPISLGGIGVREQSGVTLFAQVGVLSAKVVAFEFIAYLVGIIATIPGGLIFAFRKDHKAKI